MDHLYFLFYYWFTSYILCFYLNNICIVLQLLLITTLQYFHYNIYRPPVDPMRTVQRCVFCENLTPQHYVHCHSCKKCIPVTWNHFGFFQQCALPQFVRRYIYLLRFILIQRIVMFILLSRMFYVTLAIDTYLLYKTKSINI